jgi:hypothetical protein
MLIRLVALGALAGACACAAQIGIYYSFDSEPPPVSFSQLQSELSRILEFGGVTVEWRNIATREPEEFREIFVIRFHGKCSPIDSGLGWMTPTGRQLAGTQTINGHVLPFADVNCDLLRSYLAPVMESMDAEASSAAMGRAMARVVAHELYHMLTGSNTHARNGIARAEHSRDQLTANSFLFAKPEIEWMRAWATNQPAEAPEDQPGP